MNVHHQRPTGGRAILLFCGGLLAAAGVFALAAVLILPALTDGPSPARTPASDRPSPTAREQGARFVTKGECVAIEGSAAEPLLRLISCGPGGYQVLHRAEGTIDAELSCKDIPGYEYNFSYDSALDSLDFVLCLKQL